MIVVADTSVILNLCRIQHEYLLQQLFQRVMIPNQVANEFSRLSKSQIRFANLDMPDWIEISSTFEPFPPEVVQAGLDLGESAVITLCLRKNADALLIDESLGRIIAAKPGIRTIGILGILIESQKRKLIPTVKFLLENWKEAGFWIAPDLRNRVLRPAGE
jgi:predicted nucleic acid-binding protein